MKDKNLDIVKRFIGGNSGQTLAEYALILALIAIVTVTIMTTLGTKITAVFQNMINSLGH